ncbi:MAG: hypothetical protein M1812_000448 [Candelaria pacifica]|nr:MAG: hypothetical protein M1812_000448 [Candelaria pacifica]
MSRTPHDDSLASTAHTEFDTILNFRDVFDTVNKFTGSRYGLERRLYRSARPDDASSKDRQKLVKDIKIKNIIDLRSKYDPKTLLLLEGNRLEAENYLRSEHIKQAQKHDAKVASSAAVPQSNNAVAEPLKIPGITYREVNINGSAFERSLLRKLSWSSFGKLIGLMALGYRTEAISILGREVMQPRGLIGLGYDSLDSSGREIRHIFEILSESSNYPVMIHCTQGKDRTGLVVLLVLLLLDVPIDAVTHDYTLSEAELLPEKESRLEEIREIGLTEDFAGTPPDWAEKMKAHVDEKYGGISQYLTSIGVDERIQSGIRNAFSL